MRYPSYVLLGTSMLVALATSAFARPVNPYLTRVSSTSVELRLATSTSPGALIVEWDKGKWKTESSEAMLKDYLDMVQSKDKGRVVYENGNIEKGFKEATKIYQQQYSSPFLAHACMEPFISSPDANETIGHQAGEQ